MAKLSQLQENDFYVIAEIGVNHNGSIDEATYLIQQAKICGVDAVKFQKRELEKIYTKKLLEDENTAEWSFHYLLPQLKQLEFTIEQMKQLEITAHELGLEFIVTPFDEYSVDLLLQLQLDAVKFSSADLVNWPLIKYGLQTLNKPAFFSTGMWDDQTIKRCVEFVQAQTQDFHVFLCQSTYPAPDYALNLRYLNTLANYHPKIGYSGHERGIDASVLAYTLGAQVIEKHITRDKKQLGPDHKASLEPHELKQLITKLQQAKIMLGKEQKIITQAETLNKELFAKSVVAKVDLQPGDVISLDNIKFMSPGKGITPDKVDSILGKAIKQNKQAEDYLSFDDFENEIHICDWPEFKFQKKWGVKCRFHDYHEYECLNTPVVEFHCSEKDVSTDFAAGNPQTELIVHAPEIIGRELFDLCSEDPSMVERSVDLLNQTLIKTRDLNHHYKQSIAKVVLHVGGMLDMDTPVDCKTMTMRAEKILRDVDVSNIDLLPENLPPRPWYLGGQWFQYGFMRPEDMAAFCKSLSLGMTFDVCHAQLYCNYAGTRLTDYAKTILPYIRHCHISDAHGIDGEGVQVNEGDIDFDALFRLLEKIDYSWVPEIWSGHVNQGKGSLHALHCLHKYPSLGLK
ncbi:MAG: N-acetylneuraminate synthase family protein [Gammaproteobacteria bacterium]|nr:N-acetylneuraminate synthase family protein [Gammaproteobacteria bacterium]MDH5731079.1 N-acetylneuraminate synthase family protein [Gammaproteobacteria bacterium]